MNSQLERIRDALAGAVCGGILTVIVFLVSLIVSWLRKTGGASFSIMPGTAVAWISITTIGLGFLVGLVWGIYLTRRSAMTSNIRKWMEKHNK